MLPFQRKFEYTGVCTRVIDGDTIEVRVDLGFHMSTTIRVRLKGVEAPEIFSGSTETREKGQEVTAFVRKLLPPHTPVHIITERDRQSFNRYVATVYTQDEDLSLRNINAAITLAMYQGLGQ
jgi:micrococcal nuclease